MYILYILYLQGIYYPLYGIRYTLCYYILVIPTIVQYKDDIL